jgi:hypothetical protein
MLADQWAIEDVLRRAMELTNISPSADAVAAHVARASVMLQQIEPPAPEDRRRWARSLRWAADRIQHEAALLEGFGAIPPKQPAPEEATPEPAEALITALRDEPP